MSKLSASAMPAQQILQIRPDTELVFRGPFDKVVTSGLRLKNPSASVVAFKVKTTAPKRYCVRPNSGLVQPNSEVEVAVMLKPHDCSGTLAHKDDVSSVGERHRFLVQSLVVDTGDPFTQGLPLEDLWAWANPCKVASARLTVALLPTEAAPSSPALSSDSEVTLCEELSPQLNASNASSAQEQRRLQRDLRRLQREQSRLCEQELKLRMGLVRESRREHRQQSQRLATWQIWSLDNPANSQAAMASVCAILLAMILGMVIGKFLMQ